MHLCVATVEQVPPGVFNVVTTPREFAAEVGLELCTSPKVLERRVAGRWWGTGAGIC